MEKLRRKYFQFRLDVENNFEQLFQRRNYEISI